ncbi:GHKL domain-containing protein [Chlorobium phaeovibrioides]|uniref:histidine kinase n=1 Tax=Chlorobium phaeovibrioides TaxID=1094 RepID=A0ABW9UMW7_CHLPH|nr:GHKL domain-containing protein [Chlorobium phaeovibrioides]
MQRYRLGTQSALLWLLAVLLWVVPASASPLVLMGNSVKDGVPLKGHMEVLEDPSGTMRFSEVLRSEGFRLQAGNVSEGYTNSTYWVRFRLQRGEGFGSGGFVRFVPGFLDRVLVFVEQPETDSLLADSYREFNLGLGVPVGERPVVHADIVAPFSFGSSGSVFVYLRVASSGMLQLKGWVYTPTGLFLQSRQHILLQSVYLSAALMVSVLSLLVFLSVRERSFLLLSLYVGNLFSSYMVLRGMHIYLFPSWGHSIAPFLLQISLGFGAVMVSLFGLDAFRKFGPAWGLVYLRFMVGAGVVDMGVSIFGGPAVLSELMLYLVMVLLILIMWMALRLLPVLSTVWRVLAGVFAVNLLLYMIYFMQCLAHIPLGYGILDVVQMFSILHLLVVFGLLANRILRSERQLVESVRQQGERAQEMANAMTHELQAHRDALELSWIGEQRSSERLRLFMAMVSHEYRTPLAIIQGNIELVGYGELQQRPIEGVNIKAMRRAVDRLVEVMDTALHQSRLLESVGGTAWRQVAVMGYIEQQVEAARVLWPKRVVRVECGVGNAAVAGDLPLLNTVLFNLLDNAQKYSPVWSEILLRCRTEGGMMVLSIQNQSTLPLQEDGDVLFRKSYRGRNSTIQQGKGVGLWIVREVIEQHGGSVALTCSLDGAVQVVIRLPLAGVER